MGISYQGLEDRYYSLLDRLDQKGIPVYNVIEPIDRLIPSFVLVLIFMAFLLVLGAYVVVDRGLEKSVPLSIEFLDESNTPLSGLLVSYSFDGENKSLETNEKGVFLAYFPPGARVHLRVESAPAPGNLTREGYEESFVMNAAIERSITLFVPTPEPTIRTVLLKGQDQSLYAGREVVVKFVCNNPAVFPVPSEVVFTQSQTEAHIEEPEACEGIIAQVVSPAEFEPKSTPLLTNITILAPKSIANLQAQSAGRIILRLINENNISVTDASFEIELLDEDHAYVDTKYSGASGSVIFNPAPGTYSASIIDPDGKYANQSVENLSVGPNQTITKVVSLTREIQLRLKVQAVDEQTQIPLGNTRISIRDNQSNAAPVVQTTGLNGEAVLFSFFEKNDYNIEATNEDYYLPLPVRATANDTNITLSMRKWGPDSRGRVRVMVQDEDQLPVAGAKVKLRNRLSHYIVDPPGTKTTDKDGNVIFFNVPPGDYYAYAEKFPAYGDNEADGKSIHEKELTEFNVQLTIGEANVKLEARDEDNELIPESIADIYSETGEHLGSLPMPRGELDFSTKADKRIYVVYSHPDYFGAQTVTQQLYPGREIDLPATLKPPLLFGKPQIQFLGMTTLDNENTHELKAGEKYLAHYRFSIPQNQAYARAGIHFRVGDAQKTENDPLEITDIWGGNLGPSSIRSTSFSPPTGQATDLANATLDNAKWINLEWQNPLPRDYYVAFEFRVKKSAPAKSRLAFHYRAYAITNANQFVRIPMDDELDESESSPEKYALYAKTFDDIAYNEGEAQACSDDFCYSLESLFGQNEQLYLNSPFSPLVHSAYRLQFALTNNADTVFNKSHIQIEVRPDSEGAFPLEISQYEIENADAKKQSGISSDTHTIGSIDLGSFTKGKSIQVGLEFKTVQAELAQIRVSVVGDHRTVFERDIDFDIQKDESLHLKAEPALLPAGVEQKITITTTEKTGAQNEKPSAQALVKLTKKTPEGIETTLTPQKTDVLGKTVFTLEASPPGTIFSFVAEKPGLSSAPLELKADDQIAAFDPAELSIALQTKKRESATASSVISNKLPTDLYIYDLSLSGKTRGLLDTLAMNAFLDSLQGTKIPANSEWPEIPESNPLLKAQLAPDAARRLKASTRLDFELLVKLEAREQKQLFAFKVPAHVSVQLGDAPENENCLVIAKKEWKGVTQGNRATIEFEIQNNCTIEGKFVSLEKLVSKLEWNSDLMGNVELSVLESGSGHSNTQTLHAGVWTTIFENIPPSATYHGLLTFTPNTGFLGKDADFSVFLDATTLTDNDRVFVNSESAFIASTIKIINLESCLKIEAGNSTGDESATSDSENANIVEVPYRASGKFSIDSSDCGNTTIDITLCRGDAHCSGGAEGGISVSPEKFSLKPGKTSQSVVVRYLEIPGIYGIDIDARTPGSNYRKVASVDALARPDEKDQIDLSKYYFIIKGKGAKDSAIVTNNHLVDEVSVDASVCDWGTVDPAKEKESMNYAGLGAAMGALAALPPMIDALSQTGSAMTNHNAQELKNLKDSCADARKQADKAREQSDKTTSQMKKVHSDSMKKNISDLEANKLAANDAKAKCTSAQAACATDVFAFAPLDPICAQLNTIYDNSAAPIDSAKQNQQELSSATSDFSNQSKSTFDQLGSDLSSSCSQIKSGQISTLKNSVSKMKDNVQSVGSNMGTVRDTTTTNASSSQDLGDFLGQKTKETINQTQDSVTQASNDVQQITIPAAPAGATPACNAALTALDESLTTLKTKLSESLENMQKTVDEIEKAQNEAAMAESEIGRTSNALDSMAQQADLSSQANSNLSNAMTGVSEGAGSFNNAATLRAAGMMGTYAGLGGMAGMMAQGLFDEDEQDPCDERSTNTLLDYFSNLAGGDAGKISLDKPGVKGNWKTNSAKVFGNWEKQEIGIVFENTDGIAEDEPLFSTVTMEVLQHPHPKTVVLPKGTNGFSFSGVQGLFSNAANNAGSPEGGAALPSTGSLGGLGNFSPVLRQSAPVKTTFLFHLKFKTKDYAVAPPEISPDSACLSGTMTGETGEKALPRIAFNWNWSDSDGIQIDSCDADNPDSIYCDATQFSIALSKRLNALNEFLAANKGRLKCPANPLAEELKRQTESYENFLSTYGIDAAPLPELDCWVPFSTTLFDGKPALLYFVENPQSQITWTTAIPDAATLQKMVFFNARLIQDGYSSDFVSDFRDYYLNQAFFNAPDWFKQGSRNGKIADFFDGSDKLVFSNKFDPDTKLPAGGTYEVSVDITLDDQLQLFANNAPSATIQPTFYLIEEARPASAFYSFPVDGFVGKNTSNGRQGYGIGFSNAGAPVVFGTFQGDAFDSSVLGGSNALVGVRTEWNTDPKRLNALASSRGALFELSSAESGDFEKKLVFSPNFATPVLARVHSEKTEEPVKAFFGVLRGKSPEVWGENASFWSGAGACLDFAGVPVNQSYAFLPDRKAESSDRANNWEFEYKFEWPAAEKGGDVYLKGYFFTPAGTSYELTSSSKNLVFATPDTGFASSVGLSGIAKMPFNDAIGGPSVQSLSEILDLVKQKNVCVTNNGSTTLFWWNTGALYQKGGSSIESREKSLKAGSSCMG